MSKIVFLVIDLKKSALTQFAGEELQSLFKSRLDLNSLLLHVDDECALYCDVSAKKILPFVLREFRKQ
ncbi:hypothetical protein NPIL_528471, partial [Nephila pilipes]